MYARTVVKSTGPLLLAGVLLTSLSACGLVQVHQVENMSPHEREAYLKGYSTGRLCNALVNPFVKAHTTADIHKILSSRKITTCYNGDQELAVASNAAVQPVAVASAAPLPPAAVSPAAKAQRPATSLGYFSVVKAMTVEDWNAWLPADDRRKDLNWLINDQKKQFTDAIAMADAGDWKRAGHTSLISMYMLLHLESLDYYRRYKMVEPADGLKNNFIADGLKQSVIDESLRNLAIVLPIESINYHTEDARKRAKYRASSTAEVKTIKRVVNHSLKDPGSSIFGSSMMIGDKYFCAEVNAKNSYGGYVGMKSMIYKHFDGGWNYWDESPMDAMGCAKAVASLILEHDW